MAYATIIVMLGLIEYIAFSMLVGRQRGRSGVQAPAVTGDEVFERYYRAHQNTLEQLVIFVPGMYATAYFASEMLAVGAGFAFLVGRALYFRAYVAEPGSRGAGMGITMAANLVLVLGGLVGALSAL